MYNITDDVYLALEVFPMYREPNLMDEMTWFLCMVGLLLNMVEWLERFV